MLSAAAFLAALLAGCTASADRSPQVGPVPSLGRDDLERAKLAADIRATQAKTARDQSATAQLLQWAPFITAAVAVVGVFFTLRSQRRDRQSERRKRHDEELARTVVNLGSKDSGVRLNTAAALTAYLGPDSPDLQMDLLAVVIANLKAESDPAVSDVLVHDLALVLRECLRQRRPLRTLDLARAPWLKRLDISGVDLTGVNVDLAFANLTRANLARVVAPGSVRGWGAVLDDARLTGANLHEARFNAAYCRRTIFHQARLVSATFKGADLRLAQFQQASLQGAHFERAQLHGAAFTEADVADTWFCDAHHRNAADLDEEALRSLAHARRWQDAHLTPAQRAAVGAHAGVSAAMPRYAARLVGQGRPDKAQRWYDACLSTDIPVEAGALRRLGEAFAAQGGTEGMRRWLAAAAALGDDRARERLAAMTVPAAEAPTAAEQPRTHP
ncbi:pentapeptide repeat-containing protein [Streptomyces sp. NPDC001389]|uniref:pentapeptide repeat-containing protein n=1 Tax=unclassified Streptomyces TaxID=2593676 RepID=UPI0036CA6D3B